MNAITKEQQTALTLPERAAVALGEAANVAKLRELAAQSASIVTVTNADGREEAHRAGMVLRTTRTSITNTGKAAREDATAFSKAVIAMEKELIAIIEPEEDRVLALRDAFDAQLAAEKAAKIAAERARTEAIEARIAIIAMLPATHAQSDAATLAEVITEHDGWKPEATFEEYADKAVEAVAGTLKTLRDMLTARQQSEQAAADAEAARIAEAERLAAEKVALAEQKAANDLVAAEQAAEAKRLADVAAAQAAAAKQEREQAAAVAKAETARLAKIAAEHQAAFDKQAAEIAAASRKLAEQQAAADARDAAALQKQQDDARREDDHGPALLLNAEFNAAIEAERVRLQSMVDQSIAQASAPDSLEALLDQVDAGELTMADIPVSDEEIFTLMTEVYSMDRHAAIDRLQGIDFEAARARLV